MDIIAQPKIGYLNSKFSFYVASAENFSLPGSEGFVIRGIDNDYYNCLGRLKEGEMVTLELPVAGTYEYGDEQYPSGQLRVKDAFTLGSGEFKQVYVFEGCPLTFFVFSDRTLLFFEGNTTPFTLFEVSPTVIRRLDENRFVFETHIYGDTDNCTLAVFDARTQVLEDSFRGCKLFADTLVCLDLHGVYWFHLVEENALACYTSDWQDGVIKFENATYMGGSGDYHYIMQEKGEMTVVRKFDGEVAIYYDTLVYHVIFAEELLLRRKADGLLYAKDIATEEEFLVGDFPLTAVKNRVYPRVEQPVQGGDITEELRELAQKQCGMQEKGAYFSVNLPKYITEEISFERIDMQVLLSVSTVGTEPLASCRRSKYYDSPNLILWEFKVTMPKEEQVFKRFLTDNSWLDPNQYDYQFAKDRWFLVAKEKETNSYSFFSEDTQFATLEGAVKGTVYTCDDMAVYLIEDKELKSITLVRSDGKIKELVGEVLERKYIERFKLLLIKSIVPREDYLENSTLHYQLFDLETLEFLEVRRKIDVNSDWTSASEENKYGVGFYDLSVDSSAYRDYYICEKEVIVGLLPYEIKSSVTGQIRAYSPSMDKVVTYEGQDEFCIWNFDKVSKTYKPLRIAFNEIFYEKASLHPSGDFALVNAKNSNEIQIFNIETQKLESFFTGTFVGFDLEGNILLEEDRTRDILVYDPKTFKKIATSQYHHYKFTSPDGKLYASLSYRRSNYHYLKREVITEQVRSEVRSNFIRKDKEELDDFTNRKDTYIESIKNQYGETVESSRQVADSVAFLELGIVGTDVRLEIPFQQYDYFNYLSISYDNKFLGLVGKPTSDGFFQLVEIDFNEQENTLDYRKIAICRQPGYATWVCGFSKDGMFATHDSTPKTYLADVPTIFAKQKNTLKIYKEEMKTVKAIEKKSYLCFSNDGRYLAMSEKGYDPKSLGGSGHQDSKALYLAEVVTGEVVHTFAEHGKTVKFAAFSADDRKLLTHSDDGVIIIRKVEL